jgi:15-cis-phytoene synthase
MRANSFVRESRTPIDDDARRCREIVRTHGRSFYLASLFLLPDQRRAIHAVYAFCRVADDIVDSMDPGRASETGNLLDAWRNQIESPTDPVMRAFARARHDYSIPVEPALELLEGVRSDLIPGRYQTWADLERYCYAVAGTVGLLSAPVMGCDDPRALVRAADLGIAMQLTNILRDVAEDAHLGRLYLPLEDLAAFGCSPESIMRGAPDGNLAGLVAFEIKRARSIYARALTGVPALDRNGQLATLAAARFYGEILAEIERADCDVFRGRARVSTTRKLRKTPGVAADFIRSAFFSSQLAHGRYS